MMKSDVSIVHFQCSVCNSPFIEFDGNSTFVIVFVICLVI